MLVDKGSVILPKVSKIIKDYNIETFEWKNRDTYINLMKVTRKIKDPSIAPLIAEKFEKMKYIDEIYIDVAFLETAKTLAVLDGKTATNLILKKIEEIESNKEEIGVNRSKNIIKGFDEVLKSIRTEKYENGETDI